MYFISTTISIDSGATGVWLVTGVWLLVRATGDVASSGGRGVWLIARASGGGSGSCGGLISSENCRWCG